MNITANNNNLDIFNTICIDNWKLLFQFLYTHLWITLPICHSNHPNFFTIILVPSAWVNFKFGVSLHIEEHLLKGHLSVVWNKLPVLWDLDIFIYIKWGRKFPLQNFSAPNEWIVFKFGVWLYIDGIYICKWFLLPSAIKCL